MEPRSSDDPFYSWLIGIVVAVVIIGTLFLADKFGRDSNPVRQPGLNGPGYENPAPGNDGSYDCAPGQGPVAVAPGDPSGLDGDNDGVGCE